MADMRPLHDWSGPPARLTLWEPAAKSMEMASTASLSLVPPSYEQEQHLHAFRACQQRHEEMSRLLIFSWEEPGQCEIPLMTDMINAHVMRHDTYHSWFKEEEKVFRRYVLVDPSSIRMEPKVLGEVNSTEWQRFIGNTPGPLNWDCFRFGILQRATGFTFFASIDHLHADSSVIALLMQDIHTNYRIKIRGEALPSIFPPGTYLDYCIAQRQRAATMTSSDPQVMEWLEFLHRNSGRMPSFPLELGSLEDRCLAECVHVPILDASDTDAFEAVCHANGARIIGGLLAAAASAERKLTGSSRYSVVTPTSTRKSPKAYRTSGWCIGVVPIDFEVADQSFAELAVAAQRQFDQRLRLANVPIERVLELAHDLPSIRPAATGGVMLSYMDMTRFPLNSQTGHDWHKTNGQIYINQGMAAQVALWFFRTQQGLTLMAAYPANDIARVSMTRYIDMFKNRCRQLTDV